MVTVISCSLWRHFYWESITLSVEDGIYERVECGKSEKGSVLLGRKQRWMWQSKAGLKKKKKKEKRKLLSALKTLGEATSCGGIFAQITLTPFPWTMFSTCVHFLHTLPQRSFFFFFLQIFLLLTEFLFLKKTQKIPSVCRNYIVTVPDDPRVRAGPPKCEVSVKTPKHTTKSQW